MGTPPQLGSTGTSALSASAPCPISRRPGPLDTVLSHQQSMREIVLMHISLCCLISSSPSIFCASESGASVTTSQICVCPRVNIAEPCTLGIRSTSAASGRIWLIARHPDVYDLLRSSYEQSSSDTGKQPHQELQATLHCLQMPLSLLCDLTDIFFSCLFVICEYSFFHLFRSNDFLDCSNSSSGMHSLYSMFRFAKLCYDLIDKFDDFWFTSWPCR